MGSNLKTTLAELAKDFAANVLAAIRQASLEEIMRESKHAGAAKGSVLLSASPRKRGGRLPRRSPAALTKVRDQIVALLAKHPKGLRSEEIREKLSLTKQELPRPLQDALNAKLVTKKGEKRLTTYFKK